MSSRTKPRPTHDSSGSSDGPRVLLALSAEDTARKLGAALQRAGHPVLQATSIRQAQRAIQGSRIGAVLLSPRLEGGSGLRLLDEARKAKSRLPVLVLTDEQDEMAATLLAMREGAFDCLAAPHDTDHVLGRLQDALRLTPAQALAVVDIEGDDRAARLVGKSKPMREVFKKLGLLANSRASVLLLGESGTGKEVTARVLHDFAVRGAEAPFVAVHCAAIPRPLVAAEIFGHAKGAFTGADRDREGRLEQAGDGTLFLDEVGDIPLETQVKLLRVLQERRFQRIGESQVRPFEARVIAATNLDLHGMVREGKFREDLFYRLNVATITLPPLRERREDIPLLAQRLLGEVAHETGRRVEGFTSTAVEKLCMADWPGNVRELRNVLTRAVVHCRGRLLDEEDLDLGADPAAAALRSPDRFPTLDEAEREHVRKALVLAKGHRGRTCSLLGVSRPTLLRKIRKYGLTEFEAPSTEIKRPVPPRTTRRSPRPPQD